MAEAVVEERPPVPRFYCHKCDEEINIPNTDYICPICSGGFVEELPPAPASNAASSSSSNASFMGSNDDPQLEALRAQVANLLASRNGPNLEININPSSIRSQPRGFIPVVPGGGRVRPQSLGLDNVLLDFLQSISVGGSGADGEMNPFENSQYLVMGSLGDYAWGREGLDTIVTQLLNQIETSGPPPLAKDKIDEIPKVEITAEEVERKLQCSVCWEDFKVNELVRKLACSHVYHEECIVPWLNLHGTCPICRKALNGEDEEDNDVHMESTDDRQTMSSATPGVLMQGCPRHQQTGITNPQHRLHNHHHGDAQPGTSSTRNATSGSGSSSQQQQQQRSNPTSDSIFGFERMDSVDLD